MSQPAPAADRSDHLTCQTPDCPNPIDVVITRLEDHEADALCMPCTMIFWLRVLLQAAQSGDIPSDVLFPFLQAVASLDAPAPDADGMALPATVA